MKKKIYYWKCQDCGLTFPKISSGEPRRGCPCCGKKGVKDFKGYQIFEEKRK